MQDSDLIREFLALLRSGETINSASAKLGIKRNGKLRYLRQKYGDFDKQIQAIKWGKTSEGKLESWTGPHNEWGGSFADPRIETFLLVYRETDGDRDAAARAAGFLPTTIESMLDPTNKKFDANLASAMREEELRHLWQMEDDAKRKARTGDATMQRFILERRMPEYGQRATSATEANDAKFNQDSLRKAMEELRKDLLAFRQSAGRVERANPDAGPGKPSTDGGRVEPVSGTPADETEVN